MNLKNNLKNDIGIIIKQNEENVEFWIFNNERFIVSNNLIFYKNYNIEVGEWVCIQKISETPSYQISKLEKSELENLPNIRINNFWISVNNFFKNKIFVQIK